MRTGVTTTTRTKTRTRRTTQQLFKLNIYLIYNALSNSPTSPLAEHFRLQLTNPNSNLYNTYICILLFLSSSIPKELANLPSQPDLHRAGS